MGLFQLPGSGWIATARDLAFIDRLWRQWSPGFSLDPATQPNLLTEARIADVIDGADLFVVTEGGFAKRTSVDEYRVQNRGGLGIKVAKLAENRGDLAGALIVGADDEVLVVLESGKVVRSSVAEVTATGRNTMGVVFARFADDDRIIEVAKNSERNLEAQGDEPQEPASPAPDSIAAPAPEDAVTEAESVDSVTERDENLDE